jgi:Fis family transcriptional regulator
MKTQLENIVLEMYRAGVSYDDALKKFERVFILTVLRDHNGNQCRAADKLGMHRNTLRRTIRTLEIDLQTVRDTTRRLPPRGDKLNRMKERAIVS